MGTWFWIVLGFLAVLLLAGAGKSQKKGGGSADTKRIDHLHYIDLDEYECPKCGYKFRKNTMVCPKCGAKFTGTKEDDDEFIEEMEIWEDD